MACDSGAVSYTHLDVYKRQLLPTRLTGSPLRGAYRRGRPGPTRLPVAALIEALFGGPPAFRITAYDGSATGPTDAPIRWHIASEEGLRYLASAPGDLGVARAYLTDQLTFEGFPPGDPYEGFKALKTCLLYTSRCV